MMQNSARQTDIEFILHDAEHILHDAEHIPHDAEHIPHDAELRIMQNSILDFLFQRRFGVTDRSKSILLWWFFLFIVLVFKIFLCCWRLMYVFIILVKLR